MKNNNKHIGSNLDDFLAEDGTLAQAESVAIKRVIAHQLARLMERQQLTKTAMARRMHTSRAAVDRLMDPANASVTLSTLSRAANALGTNLQVKLSRPRAAAKVA